MNALARHELVWDLPAYSHASIGCDLHHSPAHEYLTDICKKPADESDCALLVQQLVVQL